jgi:hypothetical protein
VLVLRREKATQLTGIIDRAGRDAAAPRDGYNGAEVDLARGARSGRSSSARPNAGDETKVARPPHDLLVFDEATNFREAAGALPAGLAAHHDASAKPQALLTFNPPTTSEGRWVIEFFAPWLDPKHPNPAMPGELRWFATIAGKDVEVPDARPFVLQGDERIYDFDAARTSPRT